MIDWQRNREAEQNRVTLSLAGLAVILVLLVIGLYLSRKLAESTRLQDCVLAGRRECAVVGMGGGSPFLPREQVPPG